MPKSFYQFLVLLLCLVPDMHVTAQNFIGPIVETADLGFITGGHWSREKRCPPASFITAYAIRYDQQRTDEGNVVVALEAHCALVIGEGATSEVTRVLTVKAPNITSVLVSTVVNSSTYAIGFAMQTWLESKGDQGGIGGHQFSFHGESSVQAIFPADSTRRRVEQYSEISL